MSVPSRWSWLAVLLAAAPWVGHAHPHHHVEQQAQLVISETSVDLTLRIVPSIGAGASMFDALDLDQDGVVSLAEGDAFAREILRSAELSTMGERIVFGRATVEVPPRHVASQGHGVIAVRASAPMAARLGVGASLHFDIPYPRFSKTWFVQPFLDRSLAEAGATVTVDREEGARVMVRVVQVRQAE